MWHGELFGVCRALVIVRAVVFFVVACFCHTSFSADYSWGFTGGTYSILTTACSGNPVNSARYASPAVAGQCIVSQAPAGQTRSVSNVIMQNGGSAAVVVIKVSQSGYADSFPEFSTNRYGDSCPAGSTFNSATGVCNQTCTVAGQTNNSATGACECPSGTSSRGSSLAAQWDGIGRSGWSPLSQKCENISGNCARRAANDDALYSSALLTNSNNCQVSCALRVGSSGSKYSCYYTGQPAVPSGNLACTADASGELCGTAVGSNQTQNLTGGFTPGVPPGGCPSGSSQGTVNGVSGCASSSGVNVASNTGTTTGGGSTTGTNTQVTSTTTTTSTLPNGSTSTTTITTTQGQLGSAGNPLQVEQSGAKQCDPTAANYAQCINMAGAVTAGVNASNGTGSGGEGEGEGAGDCDPTAENYIECIAPQGPMPEHTTSEAQTVGEAFENFMTDLEGTGPMQLIGKMGHAFDGAGGAECPAPTFEAFGQSFTIDMHCTLFDQFGSMLANVFSLLWVLLGIRIIASA